MNYDGVLPLYGLEIHISFIKSIAILAIVCYFESNGMLAHNTVFQTKHLPETLYVTGAKFAVTFPNPNERNNQSVPATLQEKIGTYFSKSDIKETAWKCVVAACALPIAVVNLWPPFSPLYPGLITERQPSQERKDATENTKLSPILN